MERHLRGTHPLYKVFALCCFLGFLIYVSQRQTENSDLELSEFTPLPKLVNENSKIQKYYVKTSTCQIPYVDPFTPEVMEFYKPQTLVTCTNDSDLVSTEYSQKFRDIFCGSTRKLQWICSITRMRNTIAFTGKLNTAVRQTHMTSKEYEKNVYNKKSLYLVCI